MKMFRRKFMERKPDGGSPASSRATGPRRDGSLNTRTPSREILFRFSGRSLRERRRERKSEPGSSSTLRLARERSGGNAYQAFFLGLRAGLGSDAGDGARLPNDSDARS